MNSGQYTTESTTPESEQSLTQSCKRMTALSSKVVTSDWARCSDSSRAIQRTKPRLIHGGSQMTSFSCSKTMQKPTVELYFLRRKRGKRPHIQTALREHVALAENIEIIPILITPCTKASKVRCPRCVKCVIGPEINSAFGRRRPFGHYVTSDERFGGR